VKQLHNAKHKKICEYTHWWRNSKIDFSKIAYLNKEKQRCIKISTDRKELVDTTRLYWSVFDDTKVWNDTKYMVQCIRSKATTC